MEFRQELQKQRALWTADSVITLLRLYESKLQMLTTPKKKTRIWITISDKLRDYDIKMSPDQVRWKINALTKRYKQCIDCGQENRFKYFTELHNIYSQYNISCNSISELIQRKTNMQENFITSVDYGIGSESKAIIELRKNRLADKIESDRSQSKVKLENRWLEYLKKQDEQLLLKDDLCERSLKLREELLQLRKGELEMRESIELRKLHLLEKEQEDKIKIEKEKCDMLKKICMGNI